MSTTDNEAALVTPGAPTPGEDRLHPTHRNEEKGTNIMTPNTDATPDDPFEPVQLDTPIPVAEPSPERKRWQELTAVDEVIYHGGDVEKLVPVPRPSWSDPVYDYVSNTRSICNYRSEPAVIVLDRHSALQSDDDIWDPSTMSVSAKLFGDGNSGVGITAKKVVNGKFMEFGVALSLAEVQDLITALSAAADLAVSE